MPARKTTAQKVKDAVEAEVTEVKKTARGAGRKVKDAVDAEKIEVKKTARGAGRKVKEAAEKVETAPKAPARKAKAAKVQIYVQSPLGGNITPEEIAEKIPAGADCVFVRVDQNKLWWVKDEETGSENIW